MSMLSAAGDYDCFGSWDGHEFLIKLDQPVLFKGKDGIAVVVFLEVAPVPPAINTIVMQGFSIDAKTKHIQSLEGRVDVVSNVHGKTFSQQTGCTFDLGWLRVNPAVWTWNDYIIFNTKAQDDAKLLHVNYIGSNLDDFEPSEFAQFTENQSGSFKTKRKIWMNRDGQLFEGDYFSQSEEIVVIYGLNGQKFTVSINQLSDGDQLFLERCRYGQDDMRDVNSHPNQYLPPDKRK